MRLQFDTMLTVFLLLSMACLAGCNGEKTSAHTTWCILLDMSGVREDPETRAHYKENFDKIIKEISSGDALVVAMITESSINEPDFVIQHVFREFEPSSDNELIKKNEQQEFDSLFVVEKNRIAHQGDTFILNSLRVSASTDILSALHVAESIFRKHPLQGNNLILLSDMEQYSSDYKFPSENLNDERIAQIIELERSKARGIPDLTGVKVFVAGAHSKDSDRFFRIKNFWLAYFDACHATLMKEDYGAALINIQ